MIMRIFSQLMLYLFVSFMLLTPVINIPGPFFFKSLDVYANMYFISSLFVTFSFSKNIIKYKNIFLLVFGSIAILIAQVLLLEAIYGYGDPTGISMFLRMAISIIVAYGCSQVLIRKYQEGSLKFFIKVVIICAIIQGLVLWLTFLNPNFRDFMSIFFYRDFDSGADHLFMLRTPGFVPTGGDGLSMNQALLTTVGLMGVYIYFSKKRYLILLISLLIFSMMSTAFAGRSGLYLGVMFSILVVATHKNNFQIAQKALKIAFAGIIVITPIFIFSQQLGNYGQKLLDEHGYEYPLVRLLRGFIEMQSTHQYTDKTIKTLLDDMVIVPEEPLRFSFGNNDFGQLFGTAISTDVGYFRMWHGIGFAGLVLFLVGIYILPFIKVYRLRKHRSSDLLNRVANRVKTSQSQLLLFVLTFGLIANYKIFYIQTRIFVFVFFLLLFLIYHQYRIQRYQSSNFSGIDPCAD